MTRAHDRNFIYDRLIGVPDNSRNWCIASKYIFQGIKIYIYYIREGIATVVKAKGPPYKDYTIVNEWNDSLPEIYPIRVNTEPYLRSQNFIRLGVLQQLGIRRVDTNTIIVPYHLQSSLTPISDNDGNIIESRL